MFKLIFPPCTIVLLLGCGRTIPPPLSAIPADTLAVNKDTIPSTPDGMANACGLLVLKLCGEWQDDQSADRTVFHEHWDRTDDWFYAGLGFAMSGKDTSFIEYLNVHAEEGGIYYSAGVPSQNNGEYVDFKLSAANADSMVFENEEHDFPQRIVYAHQADDTWKVRVSGPGKEGWRTDRYHFHRAGGSPD